MNKLMHQTQHPNVAVLETACYPASFYAGYVRLRDGEFFPTDNATHLFHRSFGEAIAAANAMAKRDVREMEE